MTTLEQGRGQFENPGLVRFEREFLGALWQRAPRSDFILIIAAAGAGDFRFDDNPGPTSGTGHAGAHNPISHSTIIKTILDFHSRQASCECRHRQVESQRMVRSQAVTSIPATMRAVQLRAYDGNTKSIAVVELPVPRPGPGQVLIRVAASPINPSDLMFIRGLYGLTTRL